MSVTFVVEIQLSALDSSKGSIKFYKKLVKGSWTFFSDRIERVRRVLNVLKTIFSYKHFQTYFSPL